MSIGQYLPSTQFIVIVSSVLLSGGLVVAAQKYTEQSGVGPASLSPSSPIHAPQTGDWLAALRAIEGDAVGTASTDQSSSTQTLLEAARSSNVTDTVARTLLIALSEAKSQGLGSDIPTQEKLIAQAVAQIQQDRSSAPYTQEDLAVVASSPKTMKVYGNEFINAVSKHPAANISDTVIALGTAAEGADPSKLAALDTLQKEYRALAADLLLVPVPASLSPLHLKVVNNISLMADTYSNMKLVFKDSLKGLAGLQLYQGLSDETARVFTSIAQQFAENGILFSKDEPGTAWGLFLSSVKP